jgi:uncharacterized caspase-like protein/uncharacterized protein YraI
MAKFALLIGVSEYEPGLNPLPAAVKDVAAFQRILQDVEMGGFDEVKTLINPDPQTMQYAIETLFTGHSKDDLELLFFSGHGIKDDSNNLHFATRITCKNPKGDLIRSTAVPARFIREVMDNSRTKRQVIILDCCFSGAFDPSLQSKDDGSVDLPGQLGAEGRVVLTSSSSTQYSFEQQGSELSLYTRYLVEGIETGAGDLDEDGKISMRELHDYATSKVQETAPNMTPKLITLKDMGFEIVLAKAKVTDPKLRYRRQVERYSCNGSISSIGQTILCELQAQLGLSAQVAEEIEGEILKPYQDRLKNLQRYQQAFSKAIEHEYPLSSQFESELRDLRDILGLREKDVCLIEDELTSLIIPKSDVDQRNHQQKLSQYKEEFVRVIESEYPLSEQARNQIKNLQQSLLLKDEDIEEIESPILSEKEDDYQQQLKTNQSKREQEIQNQIRQESPDESKKVKTESVTVVASTVNIDNQKNPSRKNLVLLLIAGVLGVLAIILLAVSQSSQSDKKGLPGASGSTATNCNAEIKGSIRSEPSSQAGNDTVLGSGGNLPVTGVKTEGGWIQVKSSNGKAWVYSSVISNFGQIQGCLQQTVSDYDYIKSQPKVKATQPDTVSPVSSEKDLKNQAWNSYKKSCENDEYKKNPSKFEVDWYPIFESEWQKNKTRPSQCG